MYFGPIVSLPLQMNMITLETVQFVRVAQHNNRHYALKIYCPRGATP